MFKKLTRRSFAATGSALLLASTVALSGFVQDASAQAPARQTQRVGTGGIGGDLPVEMM